MSISHHRFKKAVSLTTTAALICVISFPPASFAETASEEPAPAPQDQSTDQADQPNEHAQSPATPEESPLIKEAIPPSMSTSLEESANGDSNPDKADAQETAATISDGKYIVKSAINSSYVLDNADAATTNGTKLQLWQNNETDAQVWIVSHDSQGYAIFRNASSGLAIDVSGGNSTSGTAVHLWQENGTLAQKWTVSQTTDGSYKITSALSDSITLDAWGGNASNGTQIDVYQDNQTKAQRWTIEPAQTARDRMDEQALQHINDVADGDYYIHSQLNADKVMDVSGASTANSAKIQLYTANGTNAQIWHVSHDGTGYVTLQNKASGKVADVAGGNSTQGTRVAQYQSNDTYAQKWIALKQNDGSIVFKSALMSTLALDVANGSSSNETPLQVWQANGTAAQAWTLESTAAAQEKALDLATKYKKSLADGEYALFSGLGHSQAIDVRSGSTSSGTAIQIYTSNMTNAQKWTIEHDEKGFVRIKNIASGKYITANASFASNGTAIVQQEYSAGNAAQRFIAQPINGENDEQGFYLLSALNPAKALDVQSGSWQAGTSLQLYEANQTAAQCFIARSLNPQVDPCEDILPSGWFRLSPTSNRAMAIDISGASKENGANVQLWQKNNTLAQLYSFTYKDGYYTIACAVSGKNLDVADANPAPGTNVQQWAKADSDNQAFSVKKNEDGSYTFICKANGLTLATENSEGQNGTNVQTDIESAHNCTSFYLDEQNNLLNEGIYTISPTSGSNRALDVASGSKDDNANVQAYAQNNSYAQKWKLAAVPGQSNTYTVESLRSGKLLTCGSDNNVRQNTASSDVSQYWIPSIGENGSIAFENAKTHAFLAIASSDANAANAYCVSQPSEAVTTFYLKTVDAVNQGMKEINLVGNASYSLDVTNCSYASGANIQLYASNGSGAQKWNVSPNGDGTFTIQNSETTQALDIPSGNAYSGANVQQWDLNGSNAQHWYIQYEQDGGFSIRSAIDQSLAITTEQQQNGSNVDLQAYIASENQLFEFVDTSYPNDTVLGIQRSRVVSYLESHLYDGYYLGTPYSTGFSIETCTYPNGSRRWDGFSGMNCAGFLATVYGSLGLNLWNIAANNNHSPWAYGPGGGSYVNAWRWYGYAIDNGYKVYEFNTIADLVNSGMAKKGDIVFLKTQPGTDCHIGIFWGDISRDNKMWHSGEPNQISAIYNSDCINENGQKAVLIK